MLSRLRCYSTAWDYEAIMIHRSTSSYHLYVSFLPLFCVIGGKPLTWDVTVVSTFADSYLHSTSHSAGSAAETASIRNESKYSSLLLNICSAC